MEVYGSLDFIATTFEEPKDVDKATADELAKLRAQIELAESEKQAFQEQLEKMATQPSKQSEQEIKSDRRARSKKFLP